MVIFKEFINKKKEASVKDNNDLKVLEDMIDDLVIEKAKKDSKFISYNDLKYYLKNRKTKTISTQFRCNRDIVDFCNDIETHERTFGDNRTIIDFNFVEKNIYFDYLQYLKTNNHDLLCKHGYWLIDNYQNTSDFDNFIKLRKNLI